MKEKEYERALAHVELIGAINPIEGADNIEMAEILGWHCIVKKGEVSVGEKVVYFEIDSKVDENNPVFEFLKARDYKVKTMKLGKFTYKGGLCISQGLALPLSSFPNLRADIEVGTNVTKELNVIYAVAEDNVRKASSPNKEAKYASMVSRHPEFFKKPFVKKMMKHKWFRKFIFLFLGKKKDTPKGFPTKFQFVHKTDETRIEAMPWLLENKQPLTVSEKLDGTSSTYILERKGKKKFEFFVCSRNVRMLTPDQKCYHDTNIYCDMAIKYDIENKLKAYLNENPDLQYVCIQGESVGSVQGNPLKLKEDDLYIFNFIDSLNGRLGSLTGKKIVESWGMRWVPIVATNFVLPDTMEEMKAQSNGKSAVNPSVLREGLVYRSETDNTVSFKNVDPLYLLKHNQ